MLLCRFNRGINGGQMTRARYTNFATGLSAGHAALIFAFVNPERVWSRELTEADSSTLALVVILPLVGVLLSGALFARSSLAGEGEDRAGSGSLVLALVSAALFAAQVVMLIVASAAQIAAHPPIG